MCFYNNYNLSDFCCFTEYYYNYHSVCVLRIVVTQQNKKYNV